MNERDQSKRILTVPNLLSLFRILLIPVIIWLYLGEQRYIAATLVVALSGLTDVLDGIIARRFNAVSDVGKILDPIADKLTQAALIFCLCFRYKWMWALVALFVVKEVTQGLLGLIALKRNTVMYSAQWYGKITTAVLYISMVVLFVFVNIPLPWVNAVIAVCAAFLFMSFVMYIIYFAKELRKKP